MLLMGLQKAARILLFRSCDEIPFIFFFSSPRLCRSSSLYSIAFFSNKASLSVFYSFHFLLFKKLAEQRKKKHFYKSANSHLFMWKKSIQPDEWWLLNLFWNCTNDSTSTTPHKARILNKIQLQGQRLIKNHKSAIRINKACSAI